MNENVWCVEPFNKCVTTVKTPNKIQRKLFQAEGDFPIVSQEADFINGYWSEPSDLLNVRRPVVVFGDHTTVLKFIDFDFVVGADGVKVLSPSNAVDPKFLYYFLMAHPLKELGYARHFRLLKELEVRYPSSLAEQRRIVGVLDEAFAGLATATAHARRNLANARELFDSHLNAVYEQGGELSRQPLGECAGDVSTGPFGSLLHKRDYVEGGTPLVNPINIVDGEIIPDNRKAVDDATRARLSAYALRAGDVVIGRRGEIGRCAVVTANEAGWLCGTGSFFIRLKDKVAPAYLCHLLRSERYRTVLEAHSDRATMPSISNKQLAGLLISLPPHDEQLRLLSLIESLQDATDRVAHVITQKLAALDELKQSILARAFRGELNRAVAMAASL